MAKVEKEHLFTGGIQEVFRALGSFDLYTKYLPGVTAIQVLPAKNPQSFCQVRYELSIIKTFFYTLNMYQEEPRKVWWTLDESNLMKGNDGSWELTAKSPRETKAIYSLDVKFRGLIPSAVTDQVAKANLPLLFSGFQRMIDENFAGK